MTNDGETLVPLTNFTARIVADAGGHDGVPVRPAVRLVGVRRDRGHRAAGPGATGGRTEGAAGPEEQLRDVREIAAEGVKKVAESMMESMGGLAAEILSQWEGFSRLCRDTLGLEPMTLVKAYGLGAEDPGAEVLAEFSDATVNEATAAEWAGKWTRNWDRRFYRGGVEHR